MITIIVISIVLISFFFILGVLSFIDDILNIL
jgi:hypothetical protein